MNEYYALGVKLALDYGLAAEELLPFLTREIPETAEEVARRLAKREINETITENLPGYPHDEDSAKSKIAPARQIVKTPIRPHVGASLHRKKMRPIPVRR